MSLTRMLRKLLTRSGSRGVSRMTGLAQVEQVQSPAVPEHGDQHAEGRAGGEQVHHDCDRGDEQAAERHHQQQEPEPEDDPMNSSSLPPTTLPRGDGAAASTWLLRWTVTSRCLSSSRSRGPTGMRSRRIA
jgi:hypothetical protein